MLRRLLNILATLSLLISLISTALCVRSHWRVDVVNYDRKVSLGILSVHGLICFIVDYRFLRGYERMPGEDDATFEKRLRPDTESTRQSGPPFSSSPASIYEDDGAGFSSFNFSHGWVEASTMLTRLDVGYHKEFLVQAPYWFLILLTAPWPIIRILHSPARRRRKRLRLGQCLQCGYDLLASPTRCPECGSIPVTVCENP